MNPDQLEERIDQLKDRLNHAQGNYERNLWASCYRNCLDALRADRPVATLYHERWLQNFEKKKRCDNEAYC